MDNTSII